MSRGYMNCTNFISEQLPSEEGLRRFSQYFSKYNYSVFDYKSLNSAIMELYALPHTNGYAILRAYCHKIGRSDLLRKCVIEYIDHTGFQAYAASDNDYHYIAISSAVPALLQTLFQDMLSSTTPFSLQKCEDPHKYIFPNSLEINQPIVSKIKLEIETNILDTIPLERWKRILATKLAELAIVFVIAHEIGHLVYGHSLLHQKKGFNAIGEIAAGNRRRNRINDYISQIWEIQADRFAVGLMYSYINSHQEKDKLLKWLMCIKHGKTDIELMKRATYSVSFVLFLIGQKQSEVNALGTHPSALVRQTFITTQFIQILTDILGHDENEVFAAITLAAEMAERAWNRYGMEFGNFSEKMSDLSTTVTLLDKTEKRVKHLWEKYQWVIYYKQ